MRTLSFLTEVWIIPTWGIWSVILRLIMRHIRGQFGSIITGNIQYSPISGRKQTLFLYRLMSDIYLYRRILKNCNIRNTVNFSGRKYSLRILFWINYKIQFCYYWWIWHNVFIQWDSDIFGVLNAVNLYRAIVNVVPHPSLSLNPKLVRK